MLCKKKIFLVIILLSTCLSYAQNTIWFTPNRGQWEAPIKYKTKLNSGEMILENTGFTYHFHNWSEKYHKHHEEVEHDDFLFKGQVVRTKFINANLPTMKEGKTSPYYSNFYLSNDSSKWKSKVKDFGSISYQELYDGIDMKIYTSNNTLKYDFIIAPYSSLEKLKVDYSGMDELWIDKEGNLHVKTAFGEIIEKSPIAFQLVNGKKKLVDVHFHLDSNQLSFDIGKYNEKLELVIDPELTFSSFTGSTADNWGYTATPDTLGNLYAGGIVFGGGYPFITGSYDANFNGGLGSFGIDIGISKFNTNGSNLLYSTYIGGSGNESPHSLVVNQSGELFILGSTCSPDYPTSAAAYNPVYNAGGGIEVIGNVIQYNGSDIVVSKLSADGSTLSASTFIGGSGLDGLSYSTPLRYNYGDDFRGEIVVDENSNVYVASTTRSADFPLQNEFDNSLGGVQDGIVFKLDPNLSNLLFSSYMGGSNIDATYSVQLDNGGNIFVAGGTTSSDLQGTTGALEPSYLGGMADGYVSRIDGTTFNLTRTSYIGTTDYNQVYFVQLDLDDDVYLFGQSDNGYPVNGPVYNNPNSGQFIHKLSNDLTTSLWSTSIGASSGNVEISPTAFLVSDCYDIFISGWGGVTNASNSLATGSSSNGFPLTADAYQSVTTGNNFYLGVLDRDAQFLKYATYFGGTSSSNNHVDGGTSRFDKKGSIYHAVCASCGALSTGFTTTPGVWSNTAQSTNCNLAAFKFDLGIIESAISVPEPFICIPDPIDFDNDSENGNAFIWDFGDGNTSTEFSPSHLYADTGTFVVTLITIDTLQCYTTDTSQVTIEVSEFQGAVVIPVDTFCPQDPVQLSAFGGNQYEWFPAEFLDDPFSSDPIAMIDVTTEFSVIVSDTCGTDTLSFFVNIFEVTGSAFGDTIICAGDSIQISAVDAQSYLWQPELLCDDHTIQSPFVTPPTTTQFVVNLVTLDGCALTDSVLVEVELDVPQPIVPDLLNLCEGYSVEVNVSGGDTYLWSPNHAISDINIPNPIISTLVDTTYIIAFGNICGFVYDSLPVIVQEIDAMAWSDTIVCPGEPAILYASGGVAYQWFPNATVSSQNDSITYVNPNSSTVYGVQVTDIFGCIDTAFVHVDLFPNPYVIASPDYYGFIGDSVEMSADGNGNGSFLWSPNEYIICDTCQTTTSYTSNSMTYTVYYTDENGCTTSDNVDIYFDGIIYVPNSFTPNGDGFNDIFKAEGGNIDQFYMAIFNRWGEVIFETEDMAIGWDGTYKSLNSQDGVYVWKIIYSDVQGVTKQLHGHVVLLR